MKKDYISKGEIMRRVILKNNFANILNAGFFFFFNPHPKTCLLILERGEGRERVREEKQQCERSITGCLSYVPQPGTKPTTQACVLTRNWTATFWCMGHWLGRCWILILVSIFNLFWYHSSSSLWRTPLFSCEKRRMKKGKKCFSIIIKIIWP